MRKLTFWLGMFLGFALIAADVSVAAEGVSGVVTSQKTSEDKLEESVGHIVLSGARGMGSLAKTAAKFLGHSAQTIYEKIKEKELADVFYVLFDKNWEELNLNTYYYEALKDRVTSVYIEEDQTREHGLDLITFHDMKYVMVREYSLLALKDATQGEYKTYYYDGSLESVRYFVDGKRDGPMTTYYPNGAIKYLDQYKKGKLVKRQKFNEDGKLEFEQNYQEDVSKKETKITSAKLKAKPLRTLAHKEPKEEIQWVGEVRKIPVQ